MVVLSTTSPNKGSLVLLMPASSVEIGGNQCNYTVLEKEAHDEPVQLDLHT